MKKEITIEERAAVETFAQQLFMCIGTMRSRPTADDWLDAVQRTLRAYDIDINAKLIPEQNDLYDTSNADIARMLVDETRRTRRESIAIHLMNAVVCSFNRMSQVGMRVAASEMAQTACELADELIAELDKGAKR